MRMTALPLQGAYCIEPTPFTDDRGFFARVYCREELAAIGVTRGIAQVNHSRSRTTGTIRGLHYQKPPHAEAKIVKCVRGAVYDVAVDLRRDSPTFLQWHGELLSAENMRMLLVPEGFAHGFQSLEADSEVVYFVTEPYAPGCEGAVRFDDPRVGVRWPAPVTVVSDKDRAVPLLSADFAGLELPG